MVAVDLSVFDDFQLSPIISTILIQEHSILIMISTCQKQHLKCIQTKNYTKMAKGWTSESFAGQCDRLQAYYQ